MGLSDVLAIAALVVAATSAAYTWWDRRAARPESYRAALYDRYLSITDAFVGLVREAHHALLTAPTTESDRVVIEAQRRFTEHAVRSPFIPPEVVKAGADWLREVAEVLEPEARWLEARAAAEDRGEPSPPAFSPPRDERLDDVWLRFMRRIRRETGAHQLHDQVRELTGAAAAERQRLRRIAGLRYLDTQVEVMTRGRAKAPSEEQRAREVDDQL